MKKLSLVLFVFLFIISCAYKEGVVQKADRSYLKFVGNLKNITVQIDDMQPFSINDSSSSNNKSYQVKSGKHTIIVSRNSQIIVKRLLFLDNGVTKEVQIP